MDDPRRATPRADAILADPRLLESARLLGRTRVKQAVTEALHACRNGLVPAEDVVERVLTALPCAATSLRPVLNATGVIVHTNLGRAPLSTAAVHALAMASGTTDVELDLESGRRGLRGSAATGALLRAVPDAEAAHVVNNGAAALALLTNAVAQGREVIVARGELVEIGDGFRIPALLESVGARLREVGTTNRVSVDDYAGEVTDQTAFVLKVHPSNFRVEGFTSSVSIAELAELGVPVIVDIGSGLLAPHPRLPDEPDATTALRAGADVVTCSGDKLLGGPQCGLILGSRAIIDAVRRHPLARALRVDKLTLAALEATLTGPESPVMTALSISPVALRARAERLADAIGAPAEAVPSLAVVGGGGAPGVTLPSAAVALPSGLAESLRTGEVPVVGRVHEGRLQLDLIMVPEESDETLVQVVRRALCPDADPMP